MTYTEKKKIADNYLNQFGVSWDTLEDVNSLHDAEETPYDEQDIRDQIIDLCQDRLAGSGFPLDVLFED